MTERKPSKQQLAQKEHEIQNRPVHLVPIGLAGIVDLAAPSWPCSLALPFYPSLPLCLEASDPWGKWWEQGSCHRGQRSSAWSLKPGVTVPLLIFFGVWGLVIPSYPQPMTCIQPAFSSHTKKKTRDNTVLCIHHTIYCIWSAAELGVLVSTLPCQLRKAYDPTAPGSRPAAKQKCPNRSRLSAQDVSTECKIPLWPSKHGLSCTRAHLNSPSPSQVPEMPVAWFQICFRCGQDGSRRVPCPPQPFFSCLCLPLL